MRQFKERTRLIFLSFALFEMLGQKGTVRNADRIWVSTPQSRTYRTEDRTNPVNLV